MPKKKTLEQFVNEANKKHNNKYDYSKVNYKGSGTKVCIICPEHGEFWQEPFSHLMGRGCPLCGTINAKTKNRTKENDFIKHATEIHEGIYDYSKVKYVNTDTKVCIICPEHGEFWQSPHHHLTGVGCPKCKGGIRMNGTEFIEKANKVHDNRFDYSKAKYVSTHKKVCIICPEHGEFWQTPHGHLSGQGCPQCAIENGTKRELKTTEQFIEDARKVHGDSYDYSKVKYINSRTKVCIICPEHGEFWQTPDLHLAGGGCPICAIYKNISEEKLYNFIKQNFPDAIRQYRCKELGLQSLDIFIPSLNVGIEYQGAQHFRPVSAFGGLQGHKKTIKRDKIKFEKCKQMKLKLFYFTYDKDYPNIYLDEIFINENKLLKEIINYDRY